MNTMDDWISDDVFLPQKETESNDTSEVIVIDNTEATPPIIVDTGIIVSDTGSTIVDTGIIV